MTERHQNQPTPGSEIILYQTEDGRNRIEVRLENETVWLALNQMAELFQVDKSGISRHLKNGYETGELRQEGTAAKFATVQEEGGRRVSRDLECYNLDAIRSRSASTFSRPCRTSCIGPSLADKFHAQRIAESTRR